MSHGVNVCNKSVTSTHTHTHTHTHEKVESKLYKKSQMQSPPNRSIRPAAQRLHTAQDGCECSPTQSRKFT